MENTDVKYTLILEGIDKLQSQMQGAKHHTDALSESMAGLKSKVIELVAAYAGFEFLKESLNKFEEHKVAVAELTQMYANNSTATKETLSELTELAEKIQHLTGIHSEETMAAEQNLLKYKDIKISYEQLIPLAGDMAKQFGGIESAANMLGRALENPERASRLLMQAGIAPEQKKMFENLEKTGQAAKAQAYLIEILGDKYKGLAKAAFDADPTAQLAEGWKTVQESIGELVEKGLIVAMPYIKGLFEFIKNSIPYIKEIAIAFTGVWIALKANALWSGITQSAYFALASQIGITEAATVGMTAAQESLNAAMKANPIGLVVLGLTAVVVGIVAVIDNYKRLKAEYEHGLDKQISQAKSDELSQTEAMVKKYQEKYHLTLAEAQTKAISYKQQEASEELAQKNAELLSLTKKRDMMNVTGQQSLFGNSDLDKQIQDASNAAMVAQAKKAALSGGVSIFDSAKGKKGDSISNTLNQSDKVTGTKQVTINVSINKLVELIKIQAANIKEGVNTAGEDVAKALLAAVDQFSASADI